MNDLLMTVFIIVPTVASGILCYALGYGEGNNTRTALSEELRQVKAKLASMTERDERGRFVRKEP